MDVRDGYLIALDEGTASVTVSCLGLEKVIVCVEVRGSGEKLELAGTLIEAEAFADCSSVRYVHFTGDTLLLEDRAFGGCEDLAWVILPEGGCAIEPNAFDDVEAVVFFCRRDTDAQAWAVPCARQYVLIP